MIGSVNNTSHTHTKRSALNVSKKNPTTAVESPKPVEIPNPESHPAVVVARSRHDVLAAKLSAIRAERKNLERDIGAKAGESDDDLEAKLLARGQPTDDLAKLRELRRTEKVTAQAVDLVASEVSKERDAAAREITQTVREDVFLPGVRAAVKDWLDGVKRAEAFRRLVDDIQARGVGANTYCPFNARVPMSLADPDGFVMFVKELIADGFTDADMVNAVFPNLI